ncbi:hypothetical protein IAT38_001377 [Cryptococcus sp. DSM 104549]
MGDIPALFQPFPILTGSENYLEWSTNVINLLLFHNNSSVKIIDGRYPEPYRRPLAGLSAKEVKVVTPREQYAGHSPPSAEANTLGRELNAEEVEEWEAWARLERMVRAVVMRTVSPGILQGMLALAPWGSRDMWVYAQTVHAVRNADVCSLSRAVLSFPLVDENSTGEEMEERLALFNKAAREDAEDLWTMSTTTQAYMVNVFVRGIPRPAFPDMEMMRVMLSKRNDKDAFAQFSQWWVSEAEKRKEKAALEKVVEQLVREKLRVREEGGGGRGGRGRGGRRGGGGGGHA